MTETELSKQIRKALEKSGVWVIRVQVKGGYGRRSVATGEPGLPDLCLPELGWLEVKLPGGELSPAQAAWHARAASSGINVAIASTPIEALTIASIWKAARAAARLALTAKPDWSTRLPPGQDAMMRKYPRLVKE